MADGGKLSVLFLCTGNSCRSQMAEAMLRHLGGDRFEVHRAGSSPAGYVHPLAAGALEQLGIPAGGLRSKSWHEFADRRIDAAITLCDAAAQESCPQFPGDPVRAHWPLPDPVQHPGTAEERLSLAMTIAGRLKQKVAPLVDMDWSAPRAELQQRLSRLGEI